MVGMAGFWPGFLVLDQMAGGDVWHGVGCREVQSYISSHILTLETANPNTSPNSIEYKNPCIKDPTLSLIPYGSAV